MAHPYCTYAASWFANFSRPPLHHSTLDRNGQFTQTRSPDCCRAFDPQPACAPSLCAADVMSLRIVRPSATTRIRSVTAIASAGRRASDALFDAPCEPIRVAYSSYRLVLCEIAGVIEAIGLQFGANYRDFGKGCLGHNLGRDVIHRRICDLVDEADVFVFAGGHARDNLPPRDFRIDNGLASAPSVIDHRNEILHGGARFAARARPRGESKHFGKSEVSQ